MNKGILVIKNTKQKANTQCLTQKQSFFSVSYLCIYIYINVYA